MVTSSMSPPTKLTSREIEIIKLLCEGLSLKEAAGSLGIAYRTVDTHVANIMKKWNIHSRTQLLVKAIRLGLYQV